TGFDALVPNGSFPRLAAAENYIYMTGQQADLQIFDASNPGGPQPLGAYGTNSVAIKTGVALNGPYAYVAAGLRGLEVLAVSNPAAIALVGVYNQGGAYSADVAVSGNYAYVADLNTGLWILDISQPENPQLAGTYPMVSAASCVTLSGNYAYVGSY